MGEIFIFPNYSPIGFSMEAFSNWLDSKKFTIQMQTDQTFISRQVYRLILFVDPNFVDWLPLESITVLIAIKYVLLNGSGLHSLCSPYSITVFVECELNRFWTEPLPLDLFGGLSSNRSRGAVSVAALSVVRGQFFGGQCGFIRYRHRHWLLHPLWH